MSSETTAATPVVVEDEMMTPKNAADDSNAIISFTEKEDACENSDHRDISHLIKIDDQLLPINKMTTHQPLVSSSEDDETHITNKSPTEEMESTCDNDNADDRSMNDAHTLTATAIDNSKISLLNSPEGQFQRRERRQVMISEGQKPSSSTEVTETNPISTSSHLTTRQQIVERVSKGRVNLKVKPKPSFTKEDNSVTPNISNTLETTNPHLLVNSSNNTVELPIDEDEFQNAETGKEGQLYVEPSSLLHNNSVGKNNAPNLIRIKPQDKVEKGVLEEVAVEEVAVGGGGNDGKCVVAEEETPPSQTAESNAHPDLTFPDLSNEGNSIDDDGDRIVAHSISRVFDATSQNDCTNIETEELFDVGDISGDLVDEDEAKLMFPAQNSMTVSTHNGKPVVVEAAWDTQSAGKISEALEESKTLNSKIVNTADGKPLLQFEKAFSDNEDKEILEAASKLVSQKERIAMYTSGEGFGVGEDSSVENDDVERSAPSIANESDEDDVDERIGYTNLTNGDDAINAIVDEFSQDAINQSEIGKVSSDNVATFSIEALEASNERDRRWNSNPDAVSDTDDEQDVSPTKISGIKGVAVGKRESTLTMIKIPPPPPEKLQQWIESKSNKNTPTMDLSSRKEVELSPSTPLPNVELKLSTSPYKITSPKSPTKKKPNTIIEELDLKSHKKMAEKIAFASSKAAKKFEEEYSHGQGQLPVDSSKSPSTTSPERNVNVLLPGELVGGAFSPWKIPERDDDSNISLNRAFSDSESFSNVTAAALRAMNLSEQQRKSSPQKEEKLPDESFEVSIHLDATIDEDEEGLLTDVLQWLFDEVLPPTSSIAAAFSAFDLNISTSVQADRIRAISNDDECFNTICEYVLSAVMSQHGHKLDKSAGLKPFVIPLSVESRPKAEVLATSFITFLQQVSIITESPLPWGNNNPIDSVMNNMSSKHHSSKKQRKTMQDLIFSDEESVTTIFKFLRDVCSNYSSVRSKKEKGHNRSLSHEFTHGFTIEAPHNSEKVSTVRRSNQRRRMVKAPAKPKNPLNKESLRKLNNLNLVFPKTSPSPFETAVWNDPSIILSVLSFVGNPVTVCVFKRLNVFCNRVVCENEHVLMRDAVRLGGMSKYVRPSFWLWVSEKSMPEDPIPLIPPRPGLLGSPKPKQQYKGRDFVTLKDLGAAGKWSPIIERDVTRAFGNMPPHKTGARYRQDSIVRALVTFGREELIRGSRSYQTKGMNKFPEGSQAKHFKLSSRLDHRQDEDCESSDGSLTPTDTVSDWGGISPVASYASEDIDDSKVKVVSYESMDGTVKSKYSSAKSDISDPVLCGNALTSEMKVDMQKKLRSILHALAARHQGVGYCQGMDYIVAHLLRVLQDTILLRIIKAEDWQTMPNDMLRRRMGEINSTTEIVEEVVFRVMDTFFTTYSLQHMYWPELRCLKTCCRVFEILIRQKLPVLADHFEHHDLNVGLFALGWFQTLFLYLPSMPSATVCHMWDIWLVERSFKIFFRVGTAILFLSQPTLLNHDLEGMMTYLNTFPDATLLRADILIPCALQIKITNKMLVEIEMEAIDFMNQRQGMPPSMG